MAVMLDITRETCPMTFVKVKLTLAKMAKGEQLTVQLKEGEPLENVPRSCEEQGYAVLENTDLGQGIHQLIIQK